MYACTCSGSTHPHPSTSACTPTPTSPHITPPHAQLQEDKLWTEWVEIAFTRFDSNGDGFISLEELLGQLGKDEKPERMLEAKRMLREADSNGDGRISREEFQELLVGSDVPDTLVQYDPRVRHYAVDEDLLTIDGP